MTPSGPAPAAGCSLADVQANLRDIRERLRAAGRDPADVRVVAVTKAFGPEVAQLALAAGLEDLGENYAQEILAKHEVLTAGAVPARPVATEGADRATRGGRSATWHFLGRLQTNKVRALAPIVDLWQSIDREALVRQLASRAPGAAILVQINLSGEEQKGGCAFDEVAGLVAMARSAGLDVQGLMGVAPAGPPEQARPGFRHLVELADELVLPVRSIGMSDDFVVAAEEGSTMIRIGRGLFGARPARGSA